MSTIGRAAPFLTASSGPSGFSLTISTSQAQLDVRAAAVAAGWNTTDAVTCTINSGINVTASTTGVAAVTISGSFPGGVTLVNSGNIYGMGGSGGGGAGGAFNGAQGNPGGVALYVTVAATVNNVGVLAGGGGGGGDGGGGQQLDYSAGPGGLGGTGAYASTAAGSGGSSWSANGGQGGGGGNGGALGAAGGSGSGGYRAVDTSSTSGGGGGAAGKSVLGDSNITWVATGTRTGPIA